MLELALVGFFGIFAFRAAKPNRDEIDIIPKGLADKLTKLWGVAHDSMRESKLLRAEKALLTILKIDEKNAVAYNRLGILYAKQKEYKDAIDCFEIASSIAPSASSYHNLGLIYYETEHYDKALVAFEETLKLEDSFAVRYIAYAKVQEKLGNEKLMFHELERAAELEPNKETYLLLQRAYETHDMVEKSMEMDKKLHTLVVPSGRPKRVLRPRKVVV